MLNYSINSRFICYEQSCFFDKKDICSEQIKLLLGNEERNKTQKNKPNEWKLGRA